MPTFAPSLRLAMSIVTGALVLGGTSNAHAVVCGDGLPDPNETCDDQNLVGGDGCSATCQLEPGYSCARPNRIQNGGFEQGAAGFTTGYVVDTGTQTEAACGGQRRYPAHNRFLIGNTSLMCSGYGGSANYLHVSGGGTCSLPNGTCVRGDTNLLWRQTVNGEGKRHQLSFAYSTRAADSQHSNSYLDLFVNGVFKDRYSVPQVAGQSSNWHTRTGIVINLPTGASTVDFRQADGTWRPEVALDDISLLGPSVCSQLCGNGVLDPGEACDDGNTTKGDGCYSCRVGVGYSCSGQPSVCVSATLQTAPAR